ncbi:MAG: gephyrin-like molybdotransferase Glp [Sphingobium sp.]
MSLIPVAEAQARLLALAKPPPTERISVAACAGRWLTEDIVARRDQPWTALSAMDGYAVRAGEWPGPWRLVATSAAGDPAPPQLAPGDAFRIFTGAPLPRGADAVLIQEDAAVEGDSVRSTDAAFAPGRHVRPAGSDFITGQHLLAAGSRLNAARIALAVLAGHGALPVGCRPRVALLSTGNELMPPGAPIPPGALPSSNAPMLAAMLANLPCDVVDLGIVADDMEATVAALERASDADVIVTTGGASAGDFDLVRPAIAQAGGRLDFWKIRMRPGKPLMAGTLGQSIFLGLPGNPVSAFVGATLFLLPLVRHMAGASMPLPHSEAGTLAGPLPASGERDNYFRAYHGDGGLVSVTSQDSAAVLALASADCLILRPAGSPVAQAGDRVTIIPV